jgi:hypothetical protein
VQREKEKKRKRVKIRMKWVLHEYAMKHHQAIVDQQKRTTKSNYKEIESIAKRMRIEARRSQNEQPLFTRTVTRCSDLSVKNPSELQNLDLQSFKANQKCLISPLERLD